MSHGRFGNPFEAALTGLRDLVGPQPLRGRLTDELRVDGRRCLVTGASSGLGLAIAKQLARRGAQVVMVSRSRIPAAGNEVRAFAASDRVEQIRADLSDLREVHALADALREGPPLDVVVDNAGVATPRARRTPQGLDEMFATNVLSKFLLAQRLLRDGTVPNRTYAGEGSPEQRRPRILFVSSDSHRGASAIDWDELGRFSEYGVNRGIHNYSYYKLVLNTMAMELSRRLDGAEGLDVAVHVLCPGPVATNIARDAPPGLRLFLESVFKLFFRAPDVAAGPAVLMSVDPAYGRATGRYLHMWRPRRMDDKCYDADAGARLWSRFVELLREHDAWLWNGE